MDAAPPLPARQMLDREFLEIRARILEIAAALDRIDRSPGSVAGDPRMQRILEAIPELESSDTGRAERVQFLFSLDYEPDWRKEFSLTTRD